MDSTLWHDVAQLLEAKHEVWLMDRRGHGQSDGYRNGDTLNDEANDVLAVLDAIGRPVLLVGHSSGAHVALLAARRARDLVRALILYEPPVLGLATNPLPPAEIHDDPHALAIFAMRDVVDAATGNRKKPEAYAQMLRSSFGQMLLRNARSVLQELTAYRAYEFDVRDFARVTIPALLLLGEKSPPFNRVITDTLHAVLPNSRIETLAGQGHGAMMSAPQMLADALAAYFEAV